MAQGSIILRKYLQINISFHKLSSDWNSKIVPVTKSGFRFGEGFKTKKQKQQQKNNKYD
jgi:hypothetical protein